MHSNQITGSNVDAGKIKLICSCLCRLWAATQQQRPGNLQNSQPLLLWNTILPRLNSYKFLSIMIHKSTASYLTPLPTICPFLIHPQASLRLLLPLLLQPLGQHRACCFQALLPLLWSQLCIS
jgi:hypothetical protein